MLQGLTASSPWWFGRDSGLASARYSLVRYNQSGTLDLTFGGGDGIADLPAGVVKPFHLAADSTGRIIVAGSSNGAPSVLRLKGESEPAPAFASLVSGKLTVTGTAGSDLISLQIKGTSLVATLDGASMSFADTMTFANQGMAIPGTRSVGTIGVPITQAMVNDAPEPADVLPDVAALLEGRVLVAHNAPFDRRALAGAFARTGLDWPDPPSLCTVALARRLDVGLLTTDFNLQRVAELQGVTVLNLNRLAESLRPVHVPGEVVRFTVSRTGRDPGQGVGFLDDGTMIVVEGGREYIGKEVKVNVTSVLQTSAGRMIFGKYASA